MQRNHENDIEGGDAEDSTARSRELAAAYAWSFFGSHLSKGYMGEKLAEERSRAGARSRADSEDEACPAAPLAGAGTQHI